MIRDDLTLSKYDGGKWALVNMNSNYNDIIEMAMSDYMSEYDSEYDNVKLKLFAQEAINLINACMKGNNSYGI